jgi:anti-sigma regulatory factor (Ser/Thr protein kinase)
MENLLHTAAEWRPETSVILKLANRIAEMERLADGVETWCAANGLAHLSPVLNVTLDEVVSNTINYGFADAGDHVIEVRFALAGGRVRVEVIDDGIAFDPLQKDDPDVELDLDDREVGGLGIFLVKNLMDSVNYVRDGDCNYLIMDKAV